MFSLFLLVGYVTDRPPGSDGNIQHSQYVPEPENVPPIHTGVPAEYSSTPPLHSAGPPTDSHGGQEEPFSPPELIPIAGSDHLNPTATLSHDRQVSIDSCSNLVIDEQGLTTTTATGVGGGFPHATPSSPSAGYTSALSVDQQQTHVGFGGTGSSSSSRNHPSDQQGFTPFVLASEAMEESGPLPSQGHSNEGLRQTSSHSQQQVMQEHSELLPQTGHDDDSDKNAVSANKAEEKEGKDSNVNKGNPSKQKRRHYNAYSSDDDDDVFLPNPPPKTQADRCTIAMETDEEKSTVVNEMEQQNKDNNLISTDDSLMNNSALNDGEILGVVATETEGEVTATEEELDVINDSQTEGEEKAVPLSSSAAIKTGTVCTFVLVESAYMMCVERTTRNLPQKWPTYKM